MKRAQRPRSNVMPAREFYFAVAVGTLAAILLYAGLYFVIIGV